MAKSSGVCMLAIENQASGCTFPQNQVPYACWCPCMETRIVLPPQVRTRMLGDEV